MESEDTKYRDALITLIEATGLITTISIIAKANGDRCPVDFSDLSERMMKATTTMSELVDLMDKNLSIEKKEDSNGTGSKND